ncbi:hypothetical protein K5549_021830, partial [Capra hircus]
YNDPYAVGDPAWVPKNFIEKVLVYSHPTIFPFGKFHTYMISHSKKKIDLFQFQKHKKCVYPNFKCISTRRTKNKLLCDFF